MFYYKIPIIDAGLDYPPGCILCCAYPHDGYMYCKFEAVTSVDSDWVKITESEFNVRCPDFPVPPNLGEVESTEYPGCYYRTVDGEAEWINPPMVDEVEYRTAKRHNGKPVYTKLITFPNLRILTYPHEINGDIIYFQGNAVWPHGAVDPFPMFSENGTILANAFIADNKVKVRIISSVERVRECAAIFIVEYTK